MLLLVGRERALLGTQDGGMGALATTNFPPSSKPVEVAIASSSLVSVDVITESYMPFSYIRAQCACAAKSWAGWSYMKLKRRRQKLAS